MRGTMAGCQWRRAWHKNLFMTMWQPPSVLDTPSYPPFPNRLLQPSSSRSRDNFTQLEPQQPLRRVRPIVVPPPPGFEPSSPFDYSATKVFPTTNHSSSSSPIRTTQNPLPPQRSDYSHYVKSRAIAGALAGDWCPG